MFVDDWIFFYTEAKDVKEEDSDLVDQVGINFKDKKYCLYLKEYHFITEGYDEDENLIFEASYVSRRLFDSLLKYVNKYNFIMEMDTPTEE